MNVIEQYVEFLIYIQEHVYEKGINEQCKITLIGRHIHNIMIGSHTPI